MEIFINAVLAGVMIGIGGWVNLSVGGAFGACLFAVGLLTIIYFKFWLFTGKAGLLASCGITLRQLVVTLVGNFIGAFCFGYLMRMFVASDSILQQAQELVAAKASCGFAKSAILGVLCGLLMYIAVTVRGPFWFPIMPVAVFILSGFSHCVADFFYYGMGLVEADQLMGLVPVIVGNLIGCNIIPVVAEKGK